MKRLTLIATLFAASALPTGCPGGDDPADLDVCEAYCTNIETCDPAQFDQHFPSHAQCVTNCAYAVSGEDPSTQPAACAEATRDLAECQGQLRCDQFDGAPCASLVLAQEAACP